MICASFVSDFSDMFCSVLFFHIPFPMTPACYSFQIWPPRVRKHKWQDSFSFPSERHYSHQTFLTLSFCFIFVVSLDLCSHAIRCTVYFPCVSLYFLMKSHRSRYKNKSNFSNRRSNIRSSGKEWSTPA